MTLGNKVGQQLPGGSRRRQPKKKTPVAGLAPTRFAEPVEDIYILETSELSEEIIQATSRFCRMLQYALEVESGSDLLMQDLIAHADRIVRCLSRKIDSTISGGRCRSLPILACKHVLNALTRIFMIDRLAYQVKEETLRSLLSDLLFWMLNARVCLTGVGDFPTILKALNVLVVKILENGSCTSVFVALIDLLGQGADMRIVELYDQFSDLGVECLIKLTKTLPSRIDQVDLTRLLGKIHVFFQERGLEGMRRRVGSEDKPKRIVKALLYGIVKLKGKEVRSHLSEVPVDSQPRPTILSYIDKYETLSLTGSVARMRPHVTKTSTTHRYLVGPSEDERQGKKLENGAKELSANRTTSGEPQATFAEQLSLFSSGLLRCFGYRH
ncbi:hypothetical protein R1flu_009297 [Riccia fluitans]|uniref:Uncharacterized protein n=1 Tax=Riccia fluitans TaxID=41844 RepID=A0ABD1Z1X7_9MARC